MADHVISEHLRPEEIALVKKLLGNRNCLSMGIAELAVSPFDKTTTNGTRDIFQWQSIMRPGMVCFVTDPERNNDYYIQAFNLDKGLKYNLIMI